MTTKPIRATPVQLRRLGDDVLDVPDLDSPEHLDDEVLVGYSMNMLTADQTAVAEWHLAACGECASLMERLMVASAAWDSPEGSKRLDAMSEHILSASRKHEEERSARVKSPAPARRVQAEAIGPLAWWRRWTQPTGVASYPRLAWTGAAIVVLGGTGILLIMVARGVDRSPASDTRAAAELSGASSRTPTNLTPVALAPPLTSRAAPPSDVARVEPAIPEPDRLTTPAEPTASHQLRVAIVDFDYAAVDTAVSGMFGIDVDIGKGVADLLLTYLVKDGNYVVIERAAVDKVLEEQNFSNSDRADPSAAARIGKLLGVDAIVIGTITQFGNDAKTTSVGAGGGALARVGVGGVGQKQSKAIVGLTARIVSVETGEVLAVAESLGESKRTSTSLTGGGAGWGGFGAGNVNLGSSEFQSTIIGEATKAAVEKMTPQVIGGRDRVAMRPVTVQGLVAAVAGGQVFLNVGSRAGLEPGDQMSVERPGQEITDPATGKVIRRTTTPVGVIRLVDVDGDSAIGEAVSGSGFQVKDVATKR